MDIVLAIPVSASYAWIMNARLLAEVLNLNGDERLALLEKLWDSLSDDELPLTSEEKSLLDERLADIDKNPSAESSWEEVKARLAARRM